MAVGEAQCCGVLEIFPLGNFAEVSFRNFVQKAGIHHESLYLSKADQIESKGVKLPAEKAAKGLGNLLGKIINKPSCILSNVLDDPYFENM